MIYFKSCLTVASLKKEYRVLVQENHPDKGGCHVKMTNIIAEYKEIMEKGITVRFQEITTEDVDDHFDAVADLMDDLEHETDFIDFDYI
jgi:hypothetical protein